MTPRLAACLAAPPLALLAFPAFAEFSPLGGGAMLGRAVVGLLLVVVLILACAWVARRFGFAARSSTGAPMKVVSSLALGPRDRIVMLEIDGTWVVVGVNAGGMNTLHTLRAKPASTATPAPDLASSFQQMLRNRVGKTGAKTSAATDNSSHPSS